MKAIRNEQMCSGFDELVSKAKTIEEAWAMVEADHAAGSGCRKELKCGCRLLDTDKGDALIASWGSGVYVIKDGVLECVSYNYDSSG